MTCFGSVGCVGSVGWFLGCPISAGAWCGLSGHLEFCPKFTDKLLQMTGILEIWRKSELLLNKVWDGGSTCVACVGHACRIRPQPSAQPLMDPCTSRGQPAHWLVLPVILESCFTHPGPVVGLTVWVGSRQVVTPDTWGLGVWGPAWGGGLLSLPVRLGCRPEGRLEWRWEAQPFGGGCGGHWAQKQGGCGSRGKGSNDKRGPCHEVIMCCTEGGCSGPRWMRKS